jgi:GTP-binding protein
VTHRTTGVLVADRSGESRAYALSSLVERSELFIGASTEVYEGMIIGENSRPGDMDVNPTKSKKLSAMRTQATDGDYRIFTPPRTLTLEAAIEFIAADELVEVTPSAIRLRKRILSAHDRKRALGAAFKAAQTVG